MASPPPDFAKIALRAALRRRRRRLARNDPGAAAAAAAHLPLDRLPPFSIVGGYHAVGAEMDPRAVLQRLTGLGARLALPAAVRRRAPLVFRATEEGDALVPDAMGVPAPPPGAAPLVPDLILAPLLAFDRWGRRLGQGAAYYDRTLGALRAAKSVFVIGLAYAGQEVERVPTEPHDQRLDAILTQNGYIEV